MSDGIKYYELKQKRGRGILEFTEGGQRSDEKMSFRKEN